MERFRIGLLILIVFLVITLGLDFPNLCPIHQFALDLNEDESRPQSQLAQNPIGLSFTWTSASISEPQEVNNNSVIIGDHIVVNATFENEILGMNITGSELIFRDELENTNQTRVNNNAITVDTYYLNRMNNTYEISVIGYTNTNESVTHVWENITLCNFFAPLLTLHTPMELPEDYRTLNISWDCTDLNMGEMNFFEVWISSNGGETYILLARNLTVFSFIWNSTGFLVLVYYIRVRAYSHDISFQELITVPDDYWPGDYTDDITQHPAGFTPTTGPPYGIPTLNHPDNIHYTEGTTGHSIVWEVYSEYPVSYNVWRNSTLLFSSVWNGGSIVVSVDGLSMGVYEFRLNLVRYDDDIVMVFVGERSSTSLPDLMSISVSFVGLSSAMIILVSVILIIRHKRRIVVFD